ncbi:preprotein translocase subunit SecE [Gordonia sp. ABSL1-1]|uniref:preprotein translocase subunit SecE n=1 Tax=Gordonia sp. ABSL1-1 TaxID=3053923 RepID=UPI0025723679|nr:preprotein translocase subunit SecE [Gordonia sp. ABSL1-1]MDL9936040.1 preprotein translocase subunit SecE [Gordonia sp. ABSL1-1]
MSKRDRAARAKDAAKDSAADSAAEREILDEAADDVADAAEESSAQLRPSGKRSARSRKSSAVSTTDGDAEGDSAVAVKDRKEKKKVPAEESRNPFVRIWVFLTQVVAELKKVIWPTRREMIVYTIVVLVFVVVMTAFISGIDIAFAKGVLWLFG